MSSDQIFPYQLEGARWLASRERSGLHDEAGLGKTWTAIRALDIAGWKRGVIIARAMLRQEWIIEHEKRALTLRRMIKGRTINDFVAWQRGRFDVLLLSYEMAARWAPHFTKLGEILDFVIIDEAHFVRNPSAARTRKILGASCNGANSIVQWAQQVYHLTGTCMTRDPMDAWAFLRLTHATRLSQYQYYHHFIQDEAPERAKEARELYYSCALRRTLTSVGIQLPEIFYTTLLIEGDSKKVEQYFKNHPGLDERILRALDEGGLALIDAGHLMTLRRLFGEAKAVPFSAYLIDALTSGEIDKVVVMGTHVGALGAIHHALQDAGLNGYLVNGSTSEALRVEARKSFQEDPGVRYFIGNSGTAGTGITLHAACHIFIFEAEWNPGDNEQMIKRIRRIGQKRAQHARFVILAGSFDEDLTRIIINKTKEIARIQGDELTTFADLTKMQSFTLQQE